jgi:FdhD protein
VNEAPVWIAVNGRRRVVLTCGPSATDALALGYLLAEGWVDTAADVTSIRIVSGPDGCSGVEVMTADALVARAEALRRHQVDHGCGVRHFLDCEPLPVRQPSDTVAAAALVDVFRSLFASTTAASPDGGVHAAALTDGTTLRHCAIDVARHCAVDRVIGLACLAGDAPADYGLVLTSRVSGAIALKAVRTGVRWLASRSLATPLAREIAAAGGVVIHENAIRREPRGHRGEDQPRAPTGGDAAGGGGSGAAG